MEKGKGKGNKRGLLWKGRLGGKLQYSQYILSKTFASSGVRHYSLKEYKILGFWSLCTYLLFQHLTVAQSFEYLLFVHSKLKTNQKKPKLKNI